MISPRYTPEAKWVKVPGKEHAYWELPLATETRVFIQRYRHNDHTYFITIMPPGRHYRAMAHTLVAAKVVAELMLKGLTMFYAGKA